MQHQSRKIIHKQEEERATRRARPRVRHIRTDQHIADPELVRPRGFEATEHVRVLRQSGTLQTAVLEMLANGALRHADTVACQQNGADLGRGARREFDA